MPAVLQQTRGGLNRKPPDLIFIAVLRQRLPQLARRPQQASSTSRQARTAADPGTPLAGPDSNRSTAPVTSPAAPRAPRP